MIRLLKINEGQPSIIEDILVIDPFKTIWKKNNNEDNTIRDFLFIEFMVLPLESNPYKNLEDKEREKKIIEEVLDNKYKPSELIYKGIEVYKKWLYEDNFNYKFLQSAITGAKKIINFFNEVDLKERNKSGGAIYKPTELTRALKDTEGIIKNLQSLEKKVFEEIKTQTIKGNRDINYFEK